jgi:uncharacterized protein (DUF885 family)
MKLLAISVFYFLINIFPQSNPSLQKLSKDFFDWRGITQPVTGDDVPRIERPDGWVPDYSPEALVQYRKKYLAFSKRLEEISQNGWTRADSVDFLLLHSAIDRVNWELNILQLPYSHPEFYVFQTAGTIHDLLVISSPMTKKRAENILIRLKEIPVTLRYAEENLNDPVRAFADIAIQMLKGIDKNFADSFTALKKDFPQYFPESTNKNITYAIQSFNNYRDWLRKHRSKMEKEFNVGRKHYEYFLKNIALVPFSPEELLLMSKTEWNRAVAFDAIEKLKNKGVPSLKIFSSIYEQIRQNEIDENSIRNFLVDKDVMSVPGWIKHYTNKPMPDYLIPMSGYGEGDDFTSPTRLDANCVRYIPQPSPDLSYFSLATAKDPRPIIIHEGVPGHYFQLVQSWKNPDQVRRHYFDSNSNEGIGFYVEELMLQLGLFDNSPHSKEIIYSFMRLRALRVNVDVNLALGNFSIEDAANYLSSTVPMDKESAISEAGFFASTPGQAITYQIGKIQILKLISDAKIILGDKFSLKDYHDYMMVNGNVPIALQRWEYLGLNDEIKKLWPD